MASPGLADGVSAYLRQMSARPRLTQREEAALVEALYAGDGRAAVRLVEANLRQVLEVASGYRGRGVALATLLQEGSLGLLDAVRGYDRSRGRSLAAHAAACIRHSIACAVVQHGHVVPPPPATVAAIGRVGRSATRLAVELGREPTDAELAGAIGTTAARVAKLRRLAMGLAASGEETRLDKEAALDALRIDVHALLCVLTARERRVLQLRYGLSDGRPRPAVEVGRRLGMASGKVENLERTALAKLRRASG